MTGGGSARVLINLRQLEVLRAVMRYRTTTGAAEELGMSQPAVSNAIRLAEAKLGFALFDRISNRLIPTSEAKMLFDDAEPLFTSLSVVSLLGATLAVPVPASKITPRSRQRPPSG